MNTTTLIWPRFMSINQYFKMAAVHRNSEKKAKSLAWTMTTLLGCRQCGSLKRWILKTLYILFCAHKRGKKWINWLTPLLFLERRYSLPNLTPAYQPVAVPFVAWEPHVPGCLGHSRDNPVLPSTEFIDRLYLLVDVEAELHDFFA